MQNYLTKGLLLMVMVFLGANLYAQEKLTISGYIKNAASGEEQIGASIYVKELGNGTTSNAYGFYSITLPKGKYTLVTTYVGFETLTKTIELSENAKLNFELIEKSNQLKEVIVKADKP